MFAFLDAEGSLCLRFSEERRAALAEEWGHGPVMSDGAVMKGYEALPENALDRASQYLREAQDYVETLKPK